MEKETTLIREYVPNINSDSYCLYFKGIVKRETTGLLAGFGVAICRPENDNLLFQTKGSLLDSNITVLEAELMALKRGLTEAVGLGIIHISIYCDNLQIYELLVMGRSAPAEDNIYIGLLMNDVQRIRQQLRSSIPVLVTENQVKFAYKLAMETIASEISIPMPDQKRTCHICFDDDFEDEHMFSVGLCGHQFCLKCMEIYINLGLFEGSLLACPHYQCEIKLTLTSCANLLTPKQREMWERRMKEESIPVMDRVYCPYPRCSALMSRLELCQFVQEDGSMRSCFKCGKPFCIHCKVPWHSNLSCDDYKRLGPNATENDIKLKVLANKKKWRQCEKCQHMIERSQGCIQVTCRCGYSFCYKCGGEWKEGGCRHQIEINCCLTVVFLVAVVCYFLMLLSPALFGYESS